MSNGSSTGWKGYRPHGRKDIDNPSIEIDSVTTFIKNTALRFLQIVYSEREVDCYHYDDDDERTEIKIVDQYAYQLNATETKPAIVAVRGTVSWNNIGINQGLQEMNMKTGTKVSTDLLSGNVGFSVISRVGLEAEQIASDVFNLFKFFRPTLTKFGYFTIRSMSIGPEQLIDSNGDIPLFLVSVMMQCQVQDRWVMQPKAAAELRKMVIKNLTSVNGEDTEIITTQIEGGN